MEDNRDLMIRRKRLGLRLEDVGEQFGVSAVTLSAFERGRNRSMYAGGDRAKRIGRAEYEALLEQLEAERD